MNCLAVCNAENRLHGHAGRPMTMMNPVIMQSDSSVRFMCTTPVYAAGLPRAERPDPWEPGAAVMSARPGPALLALGMVTLALLGCGGWGKDRCSGNQDCLPWRTCNEHGRCVSPTSTGHADARTVDAAVDHPDAATSLDGSAGRDANANPEDAGATDDGSMTDASTASDANVGDPSQPADAGVMGPDAACEVDERYVLIRRNSDKPVVVYQAVGTVMREVWPPGFQPGDGGVSCKWGEPYPASAALYQGRILMKDSRCLVAVSTTTMRQEELTPGQLELGGAGMDFVRQLGGTLVVSGTGMGIIQPAQIPWTVQPVSDAVNHLQFENIRFAGGDALAAVGPQSVQVWTLLAGGGLERLVNIQDPDRLQDATDPINSGRRALAYDPSADAMVVGMKSGVKVLRPLHSLTVPPPEEDWTSNNAYWPSAAAAQDGKAYVLDESDLFLLDITVIPPRSIRSQHLDWTTGNAMDVTLGCRRVFAVTSSQALMFERDTLEPLGSLPAGETSEILVVDRRQLNIPGDGT